MKIIDAVLKPLGILSDIKDWTVRKVATSLFLRYFDGYKEDIVKVVNALSVIIFTVTAWFPDAALALAIGDKWYALILLLNTLGLAFSTADRKIKEEQGIEAHPKSVKHVVDKLIKKNKE